MMPKGIVVLAEFVITAQVKCSSLKNHQGCSAVCTSCLISTSDMNTAREKCKMGSNACGAVCVYDQCPVDVLQRHVVDAVVSCVTVGATV
jgi:hypothetical protein